MFSQGKKGICGSQLLHLALIPGNEVEVQRSRSVIAFGVHNQPDLEARLPEKNCTRSNYRVLCQFRELTYIFSYWLTFVLFFNKFFFKRCVTLTRIKDGMLPCYWRDERVQNKVAKFDRLSKWTTYSSSCYFKGWVILKSLIGFCRPL